MPTGQLLVELDGGTASYMGGSENCRGYLILGVLVIRILLFRGTTLGSPIFGSSQTAHISGGISGSGSARDMPLKAKHSARLAHLDPPSNL